jgi:hypothetical protein
MEVQQETALLVSVQPHDRIPSHLNGNFDVDVEDPANEGDQVVSHPIQDAARRRWSAATVALERTQLVLGERPGVRLSMVLEA